MAHRKLTVADLVILARSGEGGIRNYFNASDADVAEERAQAKKQIALIRQMWFRLTPPSDREVAALQHYVGHIETAADLRLLRRRGWTYRVAGARVDVLTDDGRRAVRERGFKREAL